MSAGWQHSGDAGERTFAELRAAIVARYPDLEGASFTLLPAGWDCLAVDVDDRLIFRFPRNPRALAGLAREARLLGIVRPALTLPVPDLTLHPDPPSFCRHYKLRGDHLLAEQYLHLSVDVRGKLATDLARFYFELHGLDVEPVRVAGVGEIIGWLPPEEILRRVRPLLPADLMRWAESTMMAWRDLPPDPHGVTFGFFDGHGWNMAFDHARGRLNGIYDFADAGIGPLHQEFIYSNFISAELTGRVVDEYERLSGIELNRDRIAVLTGAHRLSELAENSDDPAWLPTLLGFVESWADQQRR